MPNEDSKTTAEAQILTFFAKYNAAIAKLGKALRAKLQSRLPGMSEVVYMYEKQNAFVISYSQTGQGYDGVCSLALYPEVVKLYFTKGPLLSKSDPKKLLKGSGNTVRFVEINSVADFDRAEIEVLIAAALKLANVQLDPKAKGAVILKAESQKKRAERAAKTAKPAKKTGTPKTRRAD